MSTQTPSTLGLQDAHFNLLRVPAHEQQDQPMSVSPTMSVSTGIQVRLSTIK